jgi:tetratricopeptide (TPR) repeat protein
MNIKQYSLAKQALDMSICKEDSVYDNSCWARYYYETGKMDSAITYYKKCLLIKSPYFYICENAALKLSEIYSATNNYVMANVYLRQSMVCDDSLSQNIFKQNSNLIKKLNEKIEYERKLAAEAKIHSFIVFTIILLFVIFLFVTIYYIRNKQVKNKNQREKVKKIISELHIRGNDIIIKNDLRISQLKNEISLLNNKIDKFKKSILQAEREKLITENARIESASKLRNLRIMNFMCSEIYMSFHSNNFHPTELNYFELEKLENETFDNCIDKIREMNNSINNNEIKICILIKADIPLKMIAVYLGYVLNALSMGVSTELCHRL